MNAPYNPIGAPLSVSQPCLGCSGEGEVEVLWLADDRTRWAECDDCDGTGTAKKPYCPTCESTLTADGFCVSCDDWGSLVYVERIAPGRIAL